MFFCFVYFFFVFFFFNDTATTEIYTLSLHDALPISIRSAARSKTPCSTVCSRPPGARATRRPCRASCVRSPCAIRSEEHTSELQSQSNLVCRLLLEKKNKKHKQKSPSPSKSSHHYHT